MRSTDTLASHSHGRSTPQRSSTRPFTFDRQSSFSHVREGFSCCGWISDTCIVVPHSRPLYPAEAITVVLLPKNRCRTALRPHRKRRLSGGTYALSVTEQRAVFQRAGSVVEVDRVKADVTRSAAQRYVPQPGSGSAVTPVTSLPGLGTQFSPASHITSAWTLVSFEPHCLCVGVLPRVTHSQSAFVPPHNPVLHLGGVVLCIGVPGNQDNDNDVGWMYSGLECGTTTQASLIHQTRSRT